MQIEFLSYSSSYFCIFFLKWGLAQEDNKGEWVHYKAGKKVEWKTVVCVIILITVLIFGPSFATFCPLYDMETILVFIRVIPLFSWLSE